jgi:hypothetical protein
MVPKRRPKVEIEKSHFCHFASLNQGLRAR